MRQVAHPVLEELVQHGKAVLSTDEYDGLGDFEVFPRPPQRRRQSRLNSDIGDPPFAVAARADGRRGVA